VARGQGDPWSIEYSAVQERHNVLDSRADTGATLSKVPRTRGFDRSLAFHGRCGVVRLTKPPCIQFRQRLLIICSNLPRTEGSYQKTNSCVERLMKQETPCR
jgi:hypothetical protein